MRRRKGPDVERKTPDEEKKSTRRGIEKNQTRGRKALDEGKKSTK